MITITRYLVERGAVRNEREPSVGAEGVVRIKDMTDGIGADAVLECVGTQEARTVANAARLHQRQTGSGRAR
jgi:threonine dehydrogenase-like Zn-dependent dehydrogenase